MDSEKILQELSGFPKVYRQSEEQKQNNFRKIMAHYENAPRSHFSLQKLMVGSAGVLAVLLACFFILTNTDIFENKEGEQTHQKQPDVIPEEKAFHPDELDDVNRVDISDVTGFRVGLFTDNSIVGEFTELLKSAKYYGEGEIKNSPTGETYRVFLNIGNDGDFISIQVWPKEKEPNLYEANTNTWWTVIGMDDFISANTVKREIKYEDAMQIAQTRHPDVDWEVLAESAAILYDTNKFNPPGGTEQIWKLSGITSDDKLQIMYISPVNGDVLDEKTITTEDGVDVVNAFFEKIKAGDLDAAWEMVHERAKTPSLKIARQTFDDYFTNNNLEISKVEAATWGQGGQKFSVCMCRFYQSIALEINFTGIGTKEIHVVRTDEEEEWKLFWSYEKKKLE